MYVYTGERFQTFTMIYFLVNSLFSSVIYVNLVDRKETAKDSVPLFKLLIKIP